MSEGVKGNGAVKVRILGKRKEAGSAPEEIVRVEVEPGDDGARRKRGAEAEAFYAEMSRIRAEPSREDARKAGGKALVEQSVEAVRDRLSGAAERGECDLASLTCHINACYRSFQSVRVLAWHMSYSHTDEREAMGSPWTCLVCGRVMPSVKGKNSHLATGHKDLCVLHNAECIQQRLPTTQPLHHRLRFQGGGGVGVGVSGVGGGGAEAEPFLLRDELVYDEDSDYEEDVSVPDQWQPPNHASARLQRREPSGPGSALSSTVPNQASAEVVEPVIVVDEDEAGRV